MLHSTLFFPTTSSIIVTDSTTFLGILFHVGLWHIVGMRFKLGASVRMIGVDCVVLGKVVCFDEIWLVGEIFGD